MNNYGRDVYTEEVAGLPDIELLSYAQGQVVEGWFLHLSYQRHGGYGMVLNDHDKFNNARCRRYLRQECMQQLAMQGRLLFGSKPAEEEELLLLLG